MLLGQNVRNVLINSNFGINQRVASVPLNTAAFVVDRFLWGINAGGGTLATGTVSRQPISNTHPFSLDQEFFVRIQNTSLGSSLGAQSFATLFQRVENVRTLAGKKATLSLWVQSSIPNKELNVGFGQVFGTGGSSSVLVGKRLVLTGNSALTRYDVEFEVPSVLGKIIGTGSYLSVYIDTQCGIGRASDYGIPTPVGWQGTGNIDIYRIQLNEGPPADYEPAGRWLPGIEDILCYRYFQKTFERDTQPAVGIQAGSLVYRTEGTGEPVFTWQFPVEMRTTPGFQLFSVSTSGGSGQWRNGSNTTSSSNAAATADSRRLRIGNSSIALPNADAWYIHAIVDAEI